MNKNSFEITNITRKINRHVPRYTYHTLQSNVTQLKIHFINKNTH